MNEFWDHFLLSKQSNLMIGVNLTIERLDKFTYWAKSEYSLTSINLNKELSKILIGKQIVDYPREIIDWLLTKIRGIDEPPILITNINILFDPSFELDPLTIFKLVSRNTSVIVLWPGEFNNNILSYASPEHAHYRTWSNPGVEIIKI